jgi:hypothetical protein
MHPRTSHALIQFWSNGCGQKRWPVVKKSTYLVEAGIYYLVLANIYLNAEKM